MSDRDMTNLNALLVQDVELLSSMLRNARRQIIDLEDALVPLTQQPCAGDDCPIASKLGFPKECIHVRAKEALKRLNLPTNEQLLLENERKPMR